MVCTFCVGRLLWRETPKLKLFLIINKNIQTKNQGVYLNFPLFKSHTTAPPARKHCLARTSCLIPLHHCHQPMSSTSSIVPSSIAEEWKYPRIAKAFARYDYFNPSSTILYCITNTKIPCTAKEFQSMGTTRLTVLGVAKIGLAKAPYKKPSKDKKVQQDPNATALFESFGMGIPSLGFAFPRSRSPRATLITTIMTPPST